MNDFIYMYDLFTMSVMGMGEKPRNIYKNKGTKTKEQKQTMSQLSLVEPVEFCI